MDVTLAVAILLGLGFAAAKLGQLIHLPSVTGYILVGLLLGPSGLSLMTEEAIGYKLEHFTQIALMLIAFGIGEQLELKRLRHTAKSVGYIALGESLGAFFLVGVGTFFVAYATGVGDASWRISDFLTLALLLGAVSVATAPAATLHVMRELKSVGPLTTTLMAVVAVDDGLAIMIFGIAVSAAHLLVGAGTGTVMDAIGSSLSEIISSLALGAVTGLLIDFVVHRLRRRGEMLTVGLALLVLCGEVCGLLGLSSLLAGMAAGLTIVNRDRRDVRLFRAINAFEPPIYVLFFTLAGTHLDLSALAIAGWVGFMYFLLRALGKMLGAFTGGRIAAAPSKVQHLLGLALLPQAGVAIGLIFLIKDDQAFGGFSSIVIPVVLGGVVLSELLGPVSARYAVTRAGEVVRQDKELEPTEVSTRLRELVGDVEGVQIVPWILGRLKPSDNPKGAVVFGISHPVTAAGLARMATLLAHHYRARPLTVRVSPARRPANGIDVQKESEELFALAREEVQSLGFELDTAVIEAQDVAQGILSITNEKEVQAIVLGHPIKGTAREFLRVVDAVAKNAPCQVIVVRFAGVLNTERILVPFVNDEELEIVEDVLRSLSRIGGHRITLFRVVAPDALDEELEETEQELIEWTQAAGLGLFVRCQAVATEARVQTIAQEAYYHDLLIMAATQTGSLQRLFCGSLAEDVAQHCQKSLLMVHGRKA